MMVSHDDEQKILSMKHTFDNIWESAILVISCVVHAFCLFFSTATCEDQLYVPALKKIKSWCIDNVVMTDFSGWAGWVGIYKLFFIFALFYHFQINSLLIMTTYFK